MKTGSMASLAGLVIILLAYFSYLGIGNYIDRKSGAIVEEVLAENTIHQFKTLSEVQTLIEEGEIKEAKSKLSSATETLKYILGENCSLPMCKEALEK